MKQYKNNLNGKKIFTMDGAQWRRAVMLLLTVLAFLTIFLTGCDGKNSGEKVGEETASSEVRIESIGGVYASPVADGSNYQAPAGTDAVSLYAERENLEPGTGILTLYDDADDSVLAEIPADGSQVTFGPVTEEQKVYYGMDGGTEIQISLGFELEAGKRYYAAVSEDFVRYGDVGSHAFGGKGQWPIQIEE